MLFNTDKCKVMHIGLKNTRQAYYMNGTTLQDVHEEPDLGIIVRNDFRCANQCAKVVKQANRTLGMIKRSFTHLNQHTVLLLYKSLPLVRPHLEDCVQAWRPYLQKDINLLESIQQRATKLIPNLNGKPYQDRIQILKLPTLENRRLRGYIIEVFKLLHGFTDMHFTKFLQLSSTLTRGHVSLKLRKQACIHDFWKHCSSHRVVDVWNKLPQHVVSSVSVNMFKYRHGKYVLNRGLIYARNGFLPSYVTILYYTIIESHLKRWVHISQVNKRYNKEPINA
jgi:ribonucleases P/MRP protein subunit RPP40